MKLILVLFLSALAAPAQLAVAVSPPRVVGQKAVVSMALKNSFAEKIESARAVCFLLDDQGKMVGQGAKWVIGGQSSAVSNQKSEREKRTPVGVSPNPSLLAPHAALSGLAPGGTNAFNFVIALDKPSANTNLTAKVQFSQVVLEGGKLANVPKQVTVTPAAR